MIRTLLVPFFCLESLLYAAYLSIDLTADLPPDLWRKLLGVTLCMVFSLWSSFLGGDRLVTLAMALSVAADSLLLAAGRWYGLGVTLFLAVQTVYLLRLRREGLPMYLPLRTVLPPILWAVLLLLREASPLNLLATLYFSLLAVNTLSAWATPTPRIRLFALGLTLFTACDLCVAAYNVPHLLPDVIAPFARVCMWMFYLPGQLSILLSALPEKGICHETI